MTSGDRTPLMLIHGAWLSARSWENYAGYFGERGFDVSVPEWPRKDGDVEQLREKTEQLEGLGVGEIVNHYEKLIHELDQPPVLIGHSYGGLFVELLLDRGVGRAGVALSPAPANAPRCCSSARPRTTPCLPRSRRRSSSDTRSLRRRPITSSRGPAAPPYGRSGLGGGRSRDRHLARRRAVSLWWHSLRPGSTSSCTEACSSRRAVRKSEAMPRTG